MEDKELLIDINKAINSSIKLRNKKELINQFITSLNAGDNVDEDWHSYGWRTASHVEVYSY